MARGLFGVLSMLPWPYPHFMAFAPLDCWARALFAPRVWIPILYWPRLAFALFVSTLSTIGTLPERLILSPILRWRYRAVGGKLEHAPGALIVLGYFRSGTTHLHYLLSCDPRLRTPTWSQALCPQGFWASWSFLRFFMIPFLSGTRPQDDVAIGPDWPAEDDFATNSWACASPLLGRFVLPRAQSHYERFHDLARLNPRELSRWRFLQWAFLQKLAWLSPSRGILLKSPSHTARVAELARLLPANARFVHISRDPAAVIKSNVNMGHRLSVFGLQHPPDDESVRERVVREYLDSEDKYLRESGVLPSGSLVEIRYEDLVADPMGTIERIYRELGLELTDEARRRMLIYLASVRDYKAANQRDERAAKAVASAEGPASSQIPGESARIAALVSRFGHDRPAIPKVAPIAVPLGGSRTRTRGAAALMIAIALLSLPAWLAVCWFASDRHDAIIWPLGSLIGYAGIRIAREGSVRLGVLSGALIMMVYGLMVVPGSFLAEYGHRPYYFAAPGAPRALWNLSPWIPLRQWEWYHITKSARVGALAWNNLFWVFMGVTCAYRFASRPHVNPPGRG